MINSGLIGLIREKSKVVRAAKNLLKKSYLLFLIFILLLSIISIKANITKIGYSLAENNKTLKKTKLENKLLRTKMSALKSNYRIKKIAESNGMVFPRKKDIKSVKYE